MKIVYGLRELSTVAGESERPERTCSKKFYILTKVRNTGSRQGQPHQLGDGAGEGKEVYRSKFTVQESRARNADVPGDGYRARAVREESERVFLRRVLNGKMKGMSDIKRMMHFNAQKLKISEK